MPVGEAIGHFVVRVILELVLELVIYVLFYWAGFIFLKAISLVRMRIAPLSTIHDKPPGKKKWYQSDWSLRNKKRQLKAGWVCVVGMLVWVLTGFAIYFATK